jgi:hypothetical protein
MMADDEFRPELTIAGDRDFEEWRAQANHDRMALVELVNRVLDKGVVVTGEVTISIGGVVRRTPRNTNSGSAATIRRTTVATPSARIAAA